MASAARPSRRVNGRNRKSNTPFIPTSGSSKGGRVYPTVYDDTVKTPRRKGKKKMNVFKRIIKAWLFDNNEDSDRYEEPYTKVESTPPSVDSSSYVQFKLHHASGGFVVEHRSYDSEIDRYIPPKLTVIHSDEDLGKRLKDIVFMEGLKS